MKTKIIATAALIGLTYTAAADDKALREKANALFKSIPTTIPEAITDNKITPEKIELGKFLYFEPRLSKAVF